MEKSNLLDHKLDMFEISFMHEVHFLKDKTGLVVNFLYSYVSKYLICLW